MSSSSSSSSTTTSKQAQKKFKTSDGEPKPVDLERLGSSLWLVKLPTYITDKWSTARQDEIVGNFMIGNKNGKRELYVQIPQHDKQNANVPEMLIMNETNQGSIDGSDSMLVFSKDSKHEDHFRVDGKVTKRFNMKALNPSDANNIIRARNLAQSAQKKEVQVANISEIDQIRSEDNILDFGPAAKVEAKKSMMQASQSSTGEKNLEDLKAKFFEAFNKDNHYLMKKDQIMTICSGPTVSQRDIQNLIDTYTKYHNSGRYKDHYELKSEFKS